MKWSVGQPSLSIRVISLESTPSMATSSRTKISNGELGSMISNLSACEIKISLVLNETRNSQNYRV